MCMQLYMSFSRGDGSIADRLGGRIYISHRYCRNRAFFCFLSPREIVIIFIYFNLYRKFFYTAAHVQV